MSNSTGTQGKSIRLARLDDSDSVVDGEVDQDVSETVGLLSQPDVTPEEHELERNLSKQRRQRKAQGASFLQDKHHLLFSHPFYSPARFVLLMVAVALLVFMLIVASRSLVHSLTHHAPGSTHPSSALHMASSLDTATLLSNGTHEYRRTVLLVSLDGAKPAYLDQGLTPNLQALGMSSNGVHGHGSRRAASMQPIFPTLTFPNHWSLLTGLHAETHGIIANDFHSSPQEPPPSGSSGRQFYYTTPAKSWDPAWWRGTPIWASAERAGVDAAVLMWPGPPRTTDGDRSKYFQKYVEGPQWDLDGRLSQIMAWLDMRVEKRPQLIAAYAPDIDKAAHSFGPNSPQAYEAVNKTDNFIGKLVHQLDERNLSSIIDVVVVSDHGMTETSNDRLIYLDDVLGSELMNQIDTQDGWPSVGLRFKGSTAEEREKYTQQAHAKLLAASHTHNNVFSVHYRLDLPSEYHYTTSSRIADLWAIPDLGWSFTTHSELASFENSVYAPKGNHGYSNKYPDMQAIFVARGPSFTPLPASLTTKHNMQPFPNLELYNLIARILGLPDGARAPNNGTSRFWDHHLHPHLV